MDYAVSILQPLDVVSRFMIFSTRRIPYLPAFPTDDFPPLFSFLGLVRKHKIHVYDLATVVLIIMLSVLFVVTLTLCFNGASAAPPITAHRTLAMFDAENTFSAFSPNATATSPSGPAVTKAPATECSNKCTYTELNLFNITWVQQSITATHTAATVINIVNKRTNITRTTTILNTEVSFGNITKPANINSDGTVTTAVVDNHGSTRIV